LQTYWRPIVPTQTDEERANEERTAEERAEVRGLPRLTAAVLLALAGEILLLALLGWASS
jgi:hypothetical protein